ncbi:hypothetical protein [Azospirillum griseum]|uniref:Flagellar hook-length control protein FliK n=1 Tax=Azospirillum griseum TaxID=2496639 RepID=A0A431VLU5_9PROT|nr:hypothetical protein [Azospirillum griseum]RTR22393.1 hypothetical protein EJ903_06060 [Azospirillum griseum]
MGGAIPSSPSSAAATAGTSSSTAAQTPVAEASVAKLPERLQDIARPVVLTGTVAGETPDGLTRVRTAAGEVVLDSPTPLPVDKPVTLQITPGSAVGQAAKPTALILLQATTTTATTGGSATAATGNGATPAVLVPPPTATVSVPALPLLTAGTVVPALVLAAATSRPTPAPAATTPTTATSAMTGGSAATTVGGSSAPPNGAAPAAPGGAASASSPTSSTPLFDTPVELGGDAAHPGAETPTLKPPPAESRSEAPDLPRGATVALKILTVTLPHSQGTNPQESPFDGRQSGQSSLHGGQGTADPGDSAPDTQVLHGTVAGSTPQGQPILATKQGMLALNVPASLPQGTTVTAALTDRAQAGQALAPPGGDPLAPMTERDWPAMRQVMAALMNSDPALARSLQTTMPQPNRKLTAALSFFMAAIQGGGARAWLGEDAAQALERSGRRDLLAQLDKEFESLKQNAADPLPGDWRPFTLPMLDSSGVKPIQVYVHPLKGDDEKAEGKDKTKPGSRFLIDLEMSRLGPMQLDGLVRPNHFDLILRSHTALQPDLKVQLIQVFADSVRAVGYTGGLSFQSGAKSWVKLTRAGRGALGVSA